MLAAKGVEAEDRERLLAALCADPDSAGETPADRAMLAYALKLTRTPGAMGAPDVASLREHGFDDRAIHDLCAVTAYFAFVNRIADGLGVELEDGAGEEESARTAPPV